MKNFFTAVLVISFTVLVPAGLRAADSAASNVNYDRVKEDYRTYLQELKKLSAQYKEITGEMKKVMAEEGIPTWSEEGGVEITKGPLPTGEAGVKETEKDVTVRLDLPGLKKDTIKLTIENQSVLHVVAKRKESDEVVERRVQLPSAAEGARATYEDGVLTVTIRKAQPKAISVSVR